ncbi:hypothetical protein F53441_12296 [Fusarium austroafricanum]|uniref:DUF6604 domain-containing protein n=1 Tax=Fusarium austroafricanum TaxID=2364996 RepID=A0A8H4K0E0_9HYPO|nr:hypothetical protein F53441_12296 [Fusarium austroafricanum]
MAPQNLYLSYKRDTKYLIYWMINLSNHLLRSIKRESEVSLNTTGETTVNGLVSMATIISQQNEPIPDVIYRLFKSIIQARSLVSSTFQQFMGPETDEDLKRSNQGHQHVINTLQSAFRILGGEEWEKSHTARSEEPKEDIEQIIFSNRFQQLAVNQDKGSSDEEDDPTSHTTAAARKVSQKRKGKKGTKNKKSKNPKKGMKQDTRNAANDEIPIESIRIIEDGTESDLITDYFVAVFSAVREWAELRAYMQDLWKQVAYEDLNSAVAGAVSNSAISLIKHTNIDIFVDFPGHDTYETIIKTITRSNIDEAQENFGMQRYGRVFDPQTLTVATTDVKEQVLFYAYKDLKDFILDFQANRSGKPTKAMQAKIAKWDPNFDLQKATKEERVSWRRCYTIKWLYDLVNVYSSVVVQENAMKGGKNVYENVDWSANGPCGKHRRIFGLNEFAGEITSMAMKKPGTDISKAIYPHHVFQMQCIVDSFTASRGWSVQVMDGHVLEAPAKNFRPTRDIDLFLNRTNEQDYGHTLDLFELFLEQGRKPGQFRDCFDLVRLTRKDFLDFLGEHKYSHGLETIPPSRFSDHSANGLHEFSPFLCGVGLEEEGHIPTSAFKDALLTKVGQPGFWQARADRDARQRITRPSDDIHQTWDLKKNRVFKTNSMLTTYRASGWNPGVIPDEELPVTSNLFFERIRRVKRLSDSQLEDNALTRTARASQGTDKDIIEYLDGLIDVPKPSIFDEVIKEAFFDDSLFTSDAFPGYNYLELARRDILADVAGYKPLSGFRFMGVINCLMIIFTKLEEQLSEAKNPAFREVYEKPGPWQKERRVGLAVLALSKGNEECLKIAADVFDKNRVNLKPYVYWGGLETETRDAEFYKKKFVLGAKCTVM